MKKKFFLVTTLLICLSVKGQILDTINNDPNSIRLVCRATELENIPHFVLLLGKNEVEIDNVERLGLLDLGWVQEINTLKGKRALKEFGSKAENGVVLITIKNKYIKELIAKLNNPGNQ